VALLALEGPQVQLALEEPQVAQMRLALVLALLEQSLALVAALLEHKAVFPGALLEQLVQVLARQARELVAVLVQARALQEPLELALVTVLVKVLALERVRAQEQGLEQVRVQGQGRVLERPLEALLVEPQVREYLPQVRQVLEWCGTSPHLNDASFQGERRSSP